jgi:hydrogenase maturation protein HypF
MDDKSTLAVGGDLKAALCLTRGRRAFLSQHIGDLEDLETQRAFDAACRHLSHLFRITPERVVCDLHPGYFSTAWAERFAHRYGLPLVKVQHHHAHVAALMAEHGWDGSRPVLGFSFDGTGYGTDGTVWGGEVLLANYRSFERVAHLLPVPLPGGDAGVRRPGRLALAYLHAVGIPWDPALPCVAGLSQEARGVLSTQLERGFGTAPSSSLGRLFDAVAALLGLRQEVTFEGQAAIELESLAFRVGQGGSQPRYAFAVTTAGAPDGTAQTLDPAPVLAALVEDLQRGVEPAVMAAAFHRAVADAVVEVARQQRLREAVEDLTVGLTGGVFQNLLLLELARRGLEREGFSVLWHRRVPPNDGGLALGQAMIAASQAESNL